MIIQQKKKPLKTFAIFFYLYTLLHTHLLKYTLQYESEHPGDADIRNLPPVADVIAKLRSYGQPSTLFGENEIDRVKRFIQILHSFNFFCFFCF